MVPQQRPTLGQANLLRRLGLPGDHPGGERYEGVLIVADASHRTRLRAAVAQILRRHAGELLAAYAADGSLFLVWSGAAPREYAAGHVMPVVDDLHEVDHWLIGLTHRPSDREMTA